MGSTEEPAVYKLYLPPGQKLALGFVVLAMGGIGFGFIGAPLLFQSHQAPPPLAGVFFLAVICLVLFYFLSLPHRITLARDGTVEFISILRRWEVRAQEIRSIKPSNSRVGFFLARTDGAKIRILAQFDGFHDFLTRLQALNPTVELRGC